MSLLWLPLPFRSRLSNVTSYVSCIFEDPYDGPTDPSQVIRVTKFLIDAGCYEVSLGDTLGVGTPVDVERLFRAITKYIPADRLAGHFHDTYGQAVANVVKAYELGIRTFDSSVAGLGGCPFAQGAKGNLSTEDLVYTLEKMGVSTGVDLDLLVATGEWISRQLQILNESRAGRAISAKTVGVTQTGAHPKPLNRTRSVLESGDDLRVLRSGTSINICLTTAKKGNALTTSTIHALTRLFRRFSDDERILHIILSAEGRYFCTGMDLKNTGTPEQQFTGLKELFDTIDSCSKTTIALVNGPCFGGGVGLVFACDIRLVTADTTFKLSEVQLGLCPAIISKYVIREWGIAFARTAMLTARIVGPRELAEIHAIHHIVTDRAALDVELNKLLDDLRFAAPRASSLCKKLISAAGTDAGGQNQNETIEGAFHQMMARGSESEYALKEFRRGRNTIDWANLAIETSLHAEAKL